MNFMAVLLYNECVDVAYTKWRVQIVSPSLCYLPVVVSVMLENLA